MLHSIENETGWRPFQPSVPYAKTIRHGGRPILITEGTVGNTHAECLLATNICYSLNTTKTFFFASLAEIKDFEKDVML
jgi:hypothetical protein